MLLISHKKMMQHSALWGQSKAAGPKLEAAAKSLAPFSPGQVLIIPAFNLSATTKNVLSRDAGAFSAYFFN